MLINVSTYPVVACLVFVIDPVERFHRAVLDAVFSNPFISIAATLCEDARHHTHRRQVDLDPLELVVKLGEPSTANRDDTEIQSFVFVYLK